MNSHSLSHQLVRSDNSVSLFTKCLCVVGVASGSARAGKSELIVVASLIDKAPNLGGLARTCEIFDARCLVVSDREILAHREFTLLSMSAEKWVAIEEVPSEGLAKWLAVRSLGLSEISSLFCAQF